MIFLASDLLARRSSKHGGSKVKARCASSTLIRRGRRFVARNAHGGYTFVVPRRPAPPEGIGTCGVRLPRDGRPVRTAAETSGVARTFEYFMRLNSSRSARRNCFLINRQVLSALAVCSSYWSTSAANNPEWCRGRLENREDREDRDAIANIGIDSRCSSQRRDAVRARSRFNQKLIRYFAPTRSLSLTSDTPLGVPPPPDCSGG